MKKLLLITNILTLCVLYFQACTPAGKWFKADANGSFVVPSEKGFGSCYNCATDDLHFQTPAQFADAIVRYEKTSKHLYEQYRRGMGQNAQGSISPNINAAFTDAQSCWFAADTLKKFICLMEKYSKQKGIEVSKLGVRFYYGNYAINASTYPPHNPAYENMHTLFLVPTVDTLLKGGRVNLDFDPKSSALNAGPDIITLANRIAIAPNAPAFVLTGNVTNFNMNEGDLCPPGTGCNSTLVNARNIATSSY